LPKNSIATATPSDLALLGEMGTVFANLYGESLMKFDHTLKMKI
jgi:hypothetical protein